MPNFTHGFNALFLNPLNPNDLIIVGGIDSTYSEKTNLIVDYQLDKGVFSFGSLYEKKRGNNSPMKKDYFYDN